ncbi:MAG: hypothetical protein NTZ46_03000 [Verrucomicrobia bacterium]|nr:hypothetical protein [Verrucomicrobiota bacterium]
MKSYSLLFVLVCGFSLARAEEVAPATAVPGALLETGTSQVLQTQDLLLAPAAPAAAESAPAAMTSPAPQVSLKKGTAEELRQAIRIRELKTVVDEDPEVRAQKATAAATKTEAARCVAMRNYYTLLYTKIEKLDPSLKPVLERQLRGLLVRYEQHNVAPSVLIEPITALPGSHSADHGGFAEEEVIPPPPLKKKVKRH